MQREAACNNTIGNDSSHIPSSDEQLLRNLTDHLPVALFQFVKYSGGRSQFLYVSNALSYLFEVTPEELYNDDKALTKRLHPDDIERVNGSIDQSVTSMELWDCQFRVVIPNKGLRWIRGVARPERIDNGGVLCNGYMDDITEQKKASDWIRYLNSALMNISESVIITNMESKIIYANQRVKALHGYEPEEILGQPADMMNVKPMSEENLSDLINALNAGRTYTGTELSRRKDGSTFLCEFSLTPIRGNEEATCIGVQRDITERTRIMEVLKETNERFEQLTQHSRAIAWEITRNGLFKYVSGAVHAIFGYHPEELVKRGNVFDLMVPSIREEVQKNFDLAINEGRVIKDYKCPFLDKQGNTVYLSINVIPKYNKEKQIITYRGLAIDITEKEKMEQQISNENERYKTTLLSVGEGVISTDCDGNITVMNPLAEKMTGWSQQEAAGMRLTQILTVMDEQTGKQCENPADIVLRTAAAYQPGFATILISKSGKEIPVEIIAAPIKNTIVETSGVVIVLKDFSEYRERQKQIEFLSYRDYLTGLYNRRYFEQAIKTMDVRSNLPLTVMTLDVNGLKLTNDAFGHAMGDRLLRTVADILRKACRSDDLIARLGGDEFAVLLPQTDLMKAKKIKQRIHQTAMKTKLETVVVSLAIGYSVKTNVHEYMDNVLINADKMMYKEKFNQGKTMRNKTIDTVLQNINSKFDQEKIHTERVSQYCYLISSALNLGQKEISEVKIAGLLHDIGKIMIPSDLLNKPGKLTDEEFDIVKRHPETGYQILKSVDEYVAIANYVLHHHERWDGKGYPAGLEGEAIPLQSRIIAIADSYEAMTSRRVYQRTKTVEEAKEELKRCAGSQFDPELVSVFLESVLQEPENMMDA
jgi:diguanylate cyclase (GGDEF)-like protein/PAS domain S-box-containing protein